MTDAILTMNAGSSSFKFALYRTSEAGQALLCKGGVEGIGARSVFTARDKAGAILQKRSSQPHQDHQSLLADLLGWVDSHLGNDTLVACGHRVVHGGTEFAGPVKVTPPILAKLDDMVPLAPLHQERNIAAIRAIEAARPALCQVACFDTAFHRTLAPVARRVGLPRKWEKKGVRRYGFHGLSYEYIAGRLSALSPRLAKGRTIVAHLGNGASLCALKAGQSVDTTMGFTPLDGLVMGTRCGALDPGIVLYLQRHYKMSGAEIEDLLYNHAGLLGVSGISGDMRALLASKDAAARDAVALFIFQVTRQSGAMAATLGGLDGFVFTAGIGENAPQIRSEICNRLGWLGIQLDEAANRQGQGRISAAGSRAEVWVVPTDEEATIAAHTAAIFATR